MSLSESSRRAGLLDSAITPLEMRGGRRVSVALVSFADESGTDQSGLFPYIAIAGYWGPICAWKGFSEDWKKVLEEFDLGLAFHMTDFLAERGPFANWSVPNRQSCILRLVEVINSYNLHGFAVQVSHQDYTTGIATIGRAAKGNRRDWWRHPYLPVFDGVIRQLLASIHWTLEEERLTMYFGKTSSLEPKATKIFAYYAENDPVGRDRLGDLLFDKADNCPQIQAADILASVARNYLRGIVARKTPRPLDTCDAHRYVRWLVGHNHTAFRVLTAADFSALPPIFGPEN